MSPPWPSVLRFSPAWFEAWDPGGSSPLTENHIRRSRSAVRFPHEQKMAPVVLSIDLRCLYIAKGGGFIVTY